MTDGSKQFKINNSYNTRIIINITQQSKQNNNNFNEMNIKEIGKEKMQKQ